MMSPPAGNAQKISLLYVDDEPALLEIGRLFLEKTGKFTVATAESAGEAILTLKDQPFDAIISDYQMPGMDGIAFLKHVRSAGDTTPFIIFTGKGREEVVIQALNEGADFYLQKGGDMKAQFAELSNKVVYAVARKQGEERLSESEERYRNVVETQTEFICRFLPDGTHIFVNDAYCRRFDRTAEEIIGTRFKPAIHKDDQDTVSRLFASLTPDHPVGTIDQRTILPGDRIVWDRWSTRAFFNEDGTVREYQSVGRDITELMERERQLQEKNEELAAAEEEMRSQLDEILSIRDQLEESNAYLGNLITYANAPIIVWDRGCTITRFNNAFGQLTGITPDEAIGKDLAILFPKETRDASMDLIRRAMAGETWDVVEIPIQHRSGEVRTVIWNSANIRGSDGETIIATIAQGQDITDRKKAELALLQKTEELQLKNEDLAASEEEIRAAYEQLTASEKALRHNLEELAAQELALRKMTKELADIIEFLPDATFVIDTDQRVIAWNRAMEELTGVCKEEILNRGDYAYSVPFYLEKRPILVDLVLGDNGDTSSRYPYIERDGDRLISETFIPHLNEGRGAHIWFTASPLYDDDGAIIGAIESIRDITERKAVEEQLQTVSNNIPGGMVYQLIIDPGGRRRFTYVSAGVERIFGVTQAEALDNARVLYAQFLEDDRRVLIEAEEEAIIRLHTFSCQARFHNPDGEIRWAQVQSALKKMPDGSIVCDGICIDITDRKKVEEAFHERIKEISCLYAISAEIEGSNRPHDEVLQTITGMIPGGFSYPDKTAVCIRFGEKEYISPGYEPTPWSIEAEIPIQKIPVQKRPAGAITISFMENLGILEEEETLLRNIALLIGRYCERIRSAAELYQKNEDLAASEEEIRQQLDEIIAIQHGLSLSEERYRAIFEHTEAPTVILEEDTTISLANRAFTEISGYSLEEVIGRSWTEFVDQPDLERMVALHRQRREEGAVPSTQYEFTFINRYGEASVISVIVGMIPGTWQSVASFHDLTRVRQAEAELIESEQIIRKKLQAILEPEASFGGLELSDVLNASSIQHLMDYFYRLTGIGVAIIDLRGEVLVATGWQDICTRFHRLHPETSRYCIESDTELTNGVAPGEFKLYRCKNQMWDIATPIIIGGERFGNLFLGQFFFEGEEPDREAFRNQAQRYGFDEEAYLDALDRVPRWKRGMVDTVMRFYAGFTGIISSQSYANLRLARELSEKNTLMARLAGSEEKYRRIVDTSADGIWQMDTLFRLTYVNQQMAGMLGYTPEEMIGMDIVSFIPADELSDSELRRERQRRGETDHFERSLIRKDGTCIWADVAITPIIDADDIYQGSFAMVKDITDRKAAEEALRASEERYRHLSEQVPVGLFQFRLSPDGEGSFLYLSPGSDAILGISADAVMKDWNTLLNRIHPSQGEAIEKAMKQSASTMTRFNQTILFLSDTLGEIWLQVTSDPERPEDGSTVWTGAFVDVDTERRAQEELYLEKIRLQNIIEGTLAGTWEYNLATGETIINEHWAHMLGYTLEELTPATIDVWLSSIHPDDRASAFAILENHIQGELDYYEHEVRMKHKNGDYIWVFGKGKIISWTDDHKPEWLFGTHVDITEKKAAEEAIREANKKLNLLSSITRHDILNKIMTLRSYIELGSGMVDDPALTGYLNEMEKAAAVIQKQIEFTRLYEEIGVTSPAWHSIEPLIQAIDASRRPIRHHCSKISVYADPMIEKVFQNLYENTIRHAEGATGIRVRCEAGTASFGEEDGSLLLTWEDDGPGIPDGQKEQIFERGFGKHTGFGLFLSREILSITGITIQETGVYGKGARFEIRVPAGRYRIDTTGTTDSPNTTD